MAKKLLDLRMIQERLTAIFRRNPTLNSDYLAEKRFLFLGCQEGLKIPFEEVLLSYSKYKHLLEAVVLPVGLVVPEEPVVGFFPLKVVLVEAVQGLYLTLKVELRELVQGLYLTLKVELRELVELVGLVQTSQPSRKQWRQAQ